MIFTFWEGKMPDYIRLCINTWKVPYIILDYDTVNDFTFVPIAKLKQKRYTLPHIADIVRAHVLRDNGGYWLDADTIMLTDRLPETNMLGYPDTRVNTCGYLYTEPHTEFFEEWCKYQDEIIRGPERPWHWATFANAFTDGYVNDHSEVTIGNIEKYWPERYMVPGNIMHMKKYPEFYFAQSKHLADIKETDMIMLHNSWTPKWYKQMSEDEILNTNNCTLSNILRETLHRSS